MKWITLSTEIFKDKRIKLIEQETHRHEKTILLFIRMVAKAKRGKLARTSEIEQHSYSLEMLRRYGLIEIEEKEIFIVDLHTWRK